MGRRDDVSLKGQEVRFVTSMSCIRKPILVVLFTKVYLRSEQSRFVTTMSKHKARDTGFLVRRGFGGDCFDSVRLVFCFPQILS